MTYSVGAENEPKSFVQWYKIRIILTSYLRLIFRIILVSPQCTVYSSTKDHGLNFTLDNYVKSDSFTLWVSVQLHIGEMEPVIGEYFFYPIGATKRNRFTVFSFRLKVVQWFLPGKRCWQEAAPVAQLLNARARHQTHLAARGSMLGSVIARALGGVSSLAVRESGGPKRRLVSLLSVKRLH